MKRLLILLFLFPIGVQAQNTAKISASYGMVEAVYMQVWEQSQWDNSNPDNSIPYEGSFFGLFLNPIDVKAGAFRVQAGAGYFFRRFPTVNGTHTNFALKATYNITDNQLQLIGLCKDYNNTNRP